MTAELDKMVEIIFDWRGTQRPPRPDDFMWIDGSAIYYEILQATPLGSRWSLVCKLGQPCHDCSDPEVRIYKMTLSAG